MKEINTYLNKPFPFIEGIKLKLIVSILFGVFIYLFLLVFQPFEISEVKQFKPLYVLGFGFITLIVLLLAFIIAPLLFKSFFNPDHWNIRKNFIFIFGILISISVLNWLYNHYFGSNISEVHGLLNFIIITVAVGSIPVTFFLYFIEGYLNNKNKLFAQTVSSQLHTNENSVIETPITITSENKNEDLKLDLSQLICVKSEGNYANIIFVNQGGLSKKLIRNSISNIENQLQEFECINRCHRSYIVNFENVINVTGNARNFNLEVNHLDYKIPVSRSFPKSILDSIRV